MLGDGGWCLQHWGMYIMTLQLLFAACCRVGGLRGQGQKRRARSKQVFSGDVQ